MKRYSVVVAILAIVATIVFYQGCKHSPLLTQPITNNGGGTTGGGGNGGGGNGGGHIIGSSGDSIKDSVCFSEEILPLIESNCAMKGCHDANTHAGDYNLTSYNNIRALVQPGNPNQSKLYSVLGNSGEDRMPPPPNAPLTSAQMQLIYNWIMQGAKDNIDCGLSCDTTVFTFSGAVNLTLQGYCTGCHNGGSSGGGVSLIGYSNVLVQVNNGKLWGDINHLSGFNAMPLGGSMLDACRITQIKKWIAAGAPNN